MEQEIARLQGENAALQRSLNQLNGNGTPNDQGKDEQTTAGLDPRLSHVDSPLGQYLGSHEAGDSLMDLSSGCEPRQSPSSSFEPCQRLDDVVFTQDQIADLFDIYFSCYHPFLPLLNPDRTPQHYHDKSRLLFWAIISVAVRKHDPKVLKSLSGALSKLMWATIADVPQNYHVVKAICILCVWPLPISSTSSDPTFTISGFMMQTAKQIGLHRPSHAQDFSKMRVELRQAEIEDRVKTWAACNIVAQNVSTGYGQTPWTEYDWTLLGFEGRELAFRLPPEMDSRLQIEVVVNRITKNIYQSPTDPVGLISQAAKPETVQAMARELSELEQLLQPTMTPISSLHLKAAWLHLRLTVLFDPPTTNSYRQDLEALWVASRQFLEHAFELSVEPDCNITYTTNYLFQTILAAGFVLLKLLNSFFHNFVDIEYGKSLFAQTVQCLREASVMHNDLPQRMAEVLAQLWQAGGGGHVPSSPGWDDSLDDSLQLQVTCRMSMSLMYDYTWRWREQFDSKGRDSLESALRNPVRIEMISPQLASPLSPNSMRKIRQLRCATDQAAAFDCLIANEPIMAGGESGGLMSPDFNWMDAGQTEIFNPLGLFLDGHLVDVNFMEQQGNPDDPEGLQCLQD